MVIDEANLNPLSALEFISDIPGVLPEAKTRSLAMDSRLRSRTALSHDFDDLSDGTTAGSDALWLRGIPVYKVKRSSTFRLIYMSHLRER
ncbi:hypothetical protein PM082_001661 [Marasmius tenuissimus]|nr:hypothetical protein PM082_001661 [Marasmius tenuissimus]